MADTDQSSKTEEPTGRRLHDAHSKGQVAQSQDVKTWAVLSGAAVAMAYLVPPAVEALYRTSLRFLEHPDRMQLDPVGAQAAVAQVLLAFAVIAGPTALLVMVLAAGVSFAQSGLIWEPNRIMPDPSKLSPLKGLERMFSAHALVEFAKGLVKFTVVGAISVMLVLPLLPGLEVWPSASVTTVVQRLDDVLGRMVAAAAAAMTVVAAIDYLYQRFSFLQQMRMTVQEVREELKQSEGDPHIKARIRRLRQERSRQRMMAAVPDATVVVTNPTHFAVALAYEMQTMPAPKVVAKGTDHMAQRIRAVAEAHGVPIVENPPLARALHAAADLDDEIPPEHYEAVARVIAYVLGRDPARRPA